MEKLISITIILGPFVAMLAVAVYLKIKRNKAGLGPLLGQGTDLFKDEEDFGLYLDLSLMNDLEK